MSALACGILGFFLWGATPMVGPPAPEGSGGNPGWWLPDAQTQLEMEATLIPVGKGAIFVPAMSDPSREPPYLVLSGSKVLARSPMGKRTALDPGHYRVLVGSGVQSQMTAHEVEVEDGHCTLVEADWGGLVVRVVDEHGMQFRGSYEVFSMSTGEHFGLGIGADENRGEGLRTWLLPAGDYLIVRPGESTRPRTNFLTLRLAKGENVAFTLVQQEDGSFLGGGAVGWGEGHTTFHNWRLGLLVGGDFMWDRVDHPVGKESGNALAFSGFVDWVMRYLHPRHFIYFRTQLNEGQSAQFNEDLLKTTDELQVDLSYTFRLLSWFGPYVRAGLDTNLFPGEAVLSAEDVSGIVILDQDGVVLENREFRNRLRLSESFDPLVLKEGVGLSVDVNPGLLGDLQLRVGFGARQQWVRMLLREAAKDQKTEADCTLNACYVRLETSHLVGVESTLLGSLRLGRWLMLDTELDSLFPMLSADTSDPIINWKNTLSLRLSSFASVSYVVRMDYDTRLSDSVQTEQQVLLRFSYNIL